MFTEKVVKPLNKLPREVVEFSGGGIEGKFTSSERYESYHTHAENLVAE